MKIFPRFYVPLIGTARNIEELMPVLEHWMIKVIYPGSPFLQQVVCFYLLNYGSSYAPRFIKRLAVQELFRLNEIEDIYACVRLAIVEAYQDHDPSKGTTSIVDWLSWRIPYITSKYITMKITHPIEPFDEEWISESIQEFEELDRKKTDLDILAEEGQWGKRVKYLYTRQLKEQRCII